MMRARVLPSLLLLLFSLTRGQDYQNDIHHNLSIKSSPVIYASSLYDQKEFPAHFVGNKDGIGSQHIEYKAESLLQESIRLCFCEHSETCNQATNITVLPGESFSVSVVALDWNNRSTAALIHTQFANRSGVHYQNLDKELHIVKPGCNRITFTASSVKSVEELTLASTSGPCTNNLTVFANFLPCPNGFTPSPPLPRCQCSNDLKNVSGLRCSDRDYTVERTKDTWIDFYCSVLEDEPSHCAVRHHANCPYTYCNDTVIHVGLNLPNSVCADNRAGVLCGSCIENYSVILGGSECWDCRGASSNVYVFLVLSALAGLLLVGFVTFLDLRISSGTMNGLIFYAATIHLNQSTFFPTKNNILTLFFSWLNLDLGFKACFFDGMTPVQKLWLLYAFPVYIMFLILVIVLAFQYFNLLADLYLPTLPSTVTIFVLAYMKLLRTAIAVLPFTTVSTSKQDSLVWLYDGDMTYLQSPHFYLFVLSVLFLLLFAAPYTLTLISSQFLFRLGLLHPESDLSLSIILDAHSGGSKLSSQFWLGLLLLSYSAQVTIYHFTGGDSTTNLIVAILSACSLLSVSLAFDGFYKNKLTNKLEQSFFLNIIALAALVVQLRGREGSPLFVVYLFTSIAVIVFTGIVFERCSYKFPGAFKLIGEYVSFNSLVQKLLCINIFEPHSLLQPREDSSQQVTPNVSNAEISAWNNSVEENPNDWDRVTFSDSEDREPLLCDDSTQNTTESKSTTHTDSATGTVTKKVTSSFLYFTPTREVGIACLVPSENSVQQTTKTDEEGIRTLEIESSEASNPRVSPYLPPNRLTQILEQDVTENEDHSLSVLSTDTRSTTHHSTRTVVSKVKPAIRKTPNGYSSLPGYHKHRRIPRKRVKQPINDNLSEQVFVTRHSAPSGTKTVLSTCFPPSSSPVSVIEVTSAGRTFTDTNQGVTVVVPAGAVKLGITVLIEIGILVHGPFECLATYTRVSPVLWFCCRTYVHFEKDIRFILPHCLRKVSTVGNDNLGLNFMKAEYQYRLNSSAHRKVVFGPVEQDSSFSQNRGTLATRDHSCFFCIAANQSPSLLVQKAEYCLTRIEPKPWTANTTVYFCVSYFLKSCFEAIDQQFPKDRYEIKNRTCFQFLPTKRNIEPKISIEVASPLPEDWLIAVEHPGNKEIAATDIQFWVDDDPSCALKQEYGIYPPRFHLRVCGQQAHTSCTATVSFRGILPEIDSTLVLTPVSPISAGGYSWPIGGYSTAPGGGYGVPERGHSLPAGDMVQSGLKHSVSLTSMSRKSSHQLLLDSISDELQGLNYEPGWADLELDIVCRVATKWREIGILLNVFPDKLEMISDDQPSSRARLRAVLREWHKSDSPPFYWAYIIGVLRTDCVGEKLLAQSLLEKYGSPAPYNYIT